jgi:predicted N-formylglutamate amidohydrolase
MNQTDAGDTGHVVRSLRPGATNAIVLVCEHASAFIPSEFKNLGLSKEVLTSHVAWDPGALGVAEALSEMLEAELVASGISRLIYDCNRPPDAPAAMPARSEIYDIPGNVGLTAAQRAARADAYYAPFRMAVDAALAVREKAVLVTIHSFTPVYHGKTRDVEIGILHDRDSGLADAILEAAADHDAHVVRRNEPYGPNDGVTHTLIEHGVSKGRPNVMIEVRNDLIRTADAQREMASLLAGWLRQAVEQITCAQEAAT